MNKYPDYIEIMTFYCVLSKYCFKEELSNSIYKQIIEQLDNAEKITKEHKKLFDIISSQLILSILFGDTNKKNYCENKINKMDLDEYQKQTIDYILKADEEKIFQLFGINN